MKRKLLITLLLSVAYFFICGYLIAIFRNSPILYVLFFVTLLIGILISLRLRNFIYSVINIFWSQFVRKKQAIIIPNKTHPVISLNEENTLNDAIKITFVGDLILLREAIERSYNSTTESYEFDKMFANVKDELNDSDFSIGVFEGPMAGDEIFSTSNLKDGVPVCLNFPDSFASAVKNAGFNLVTLANNHIFDKGIYGGIRTKQILDSIGLDNIGLSFSNESNSNPKIVEVRGLKIGILAYTYGQNGKEDSMFFDQNNSFILKPVLKINSPLLQKNVELVRKDFDDLKAKNPDIIIVLPHMGTQFRAVPDNTQRFWCDLFVDLGADIIFSDHPHHVQPIEWRKNKGGKDIIIVHCPGNFLNTFVEHDGDASMMVTAHVDEKSHDIIGISIVPLYSYCQQNGNWTALPTRCAQKFSDQLSRADYRRIDEVNRIVTKIAINTEIGLDDSLYRYFYLPENRYGRLYPHAVKIDNKIQDNSPFLSRVSKHDKICFIGDSVTEGTINGGYGWYEPLIRRYPKTHFYKVAHKSLTSGQLSTFYNQIISTNSDLYIIAVGAYDIRCKISPSEYIKNLEDIVNMVRVKNPEADFIFVAPWISLYFDPYFKDISIEEKQNIYMIFSDALKFFCDNFGFLFIDSNSYIMKIVKNNGDGRKYIKDFIHPNAGNGIHLYCKAVINYGIETTDTTFAL